MKNCPNSRCSRLHPDEFKGSCDGCGAPCNRPSDKPQMSPNEHLSMLRAQAGPSSPQATRNMQADPRLLEVARQGVDHALSEFYPKED